jgi:aryl-alcohol dehydrogenase-like predicted oxidoreductase
VQRIQLSPGYEISRVIRGGWQLSDSHSTTTSDDPVGDMIAFADAGITTFDCADIYTGVEELIGRFRLRYRDLRGQRALDRIKIHTKFVPDRDVLPHITRSYAESIVDTSLRRLNMERLDLVQFHWWDYGVPRWVEAAQWLTDLQRAGKIEKIGGTNFDTVHMLDMIEAGAPVASMQVQYSLLDRRPAKSMVKAARAHGVALLCYGTVAGGFPANGGWAHPSRSAPWRTDRSPSTS